MSARLRVKVAYAAPGVEHLIDVVVPAGAVVRDAVTATDIIALAGIEPSAVSYAIHGQRAHAATPLADGDRIELLRPLQADPKTTRRRRAASHPIAREARQPRTTQRRRSKVE